MNQTTPNRRASKPAADDGATLDTLHPQLQPRDDEYAVVGASLMQPESIDAFVTAGLKREHFGWLITRQLWIAIETIRARGLMPTLSSMRAELVNMKADAGPVDIARAADFAFRARSQEAVESVVHSIRTAWVRRKLLQEIDAAKAAIHTGEDVEVVRGSMFAALDDTCDDSIPVEHDMFATMMAPILERLSSQEAAASTLPSRVTGLDDVILGGIRRKSLVIVGARTSVGKTALATSMAQAWAEMGLRTSYMSLEMDREGIGHRYLSAATGIATSSMANGDLQPHEIDALFTAGMRNLPLATYDQPMSLPQLRARAYQHRRMLGGELDLLIVDYVQLVDVDQRYGENRQQALGRVSRALKQLAKKLDCVVIVLAQLVRAADERKEPELSDLRESGDLEQDADMVWLLFRDRSKGCGRNDVILKIAKNRQGPTGKVFLRFVPESMRFAFRPST